MNRKKFLQAVLSICMLSVFFTACDKDDVKEPENKPATKKLSKIAYDDGSYQTMAYNASGKVATVVVHTKYGGNNSSTETYNFTYNGNMLTEIQSDFGYKYVYSYANNLVSKMEIFVISGSKAAVYEYTYKNGMLWKTDGYMAPPGGGPIPANPYQRYETEYHPTGNLSKVVLYYRDPVSGQLEKAYDFVMDHYDNKKNTTVQFESNPYLPLDNFNPNNPLEELHYNKAAILEQTETHTYTYDADGYPLTRKTTSKQIGMADRQTSAIFHY